MRIPVFFTAVFIALGLAESAAALIFVLAPETVVARRPAVVAVEAPLEVAALPGPPKPVNRERNEIRCMATPPAQEDDGCLRCQNADSLIQKWPSGISTKGAPK